MARAFISILGTNDYLEAHHKLDGQISSDADKYVQEFLIKRKCKQWGENDEIRIFLTEQSEEKNWKDNGHQNKENIGLENRLKKMELKPKIISQKIPTGNNEEELWQIFDIISSSFNKDDEVIIDITHSFRFLPLLLTVILNYIKQIENINIRGIYYAAFESLGTFGQIEKLPLEKRIVPILDLTPIVELQEWTLATYNYVNHAEIKNLQKLVDRKNKELKKKSSNDKNNLNLESLKKTVSKLNRLSNNIALCRGKDIVDFDYNKVKSELKKLESESLIDGKNLTIKPIEKLFGVINKKIEEFENNDIDNGFIAAKWALDHNLFQQAITILQETVISKILVDIDYNYQDASFEQRKIVGMAIENIKLPKQYHSVKEKELYNNVRKLKKSLIIKKGYSKLKELRNDINHAGFDKKSKHFSEIKGQIAGLLESIRKKML